MREGRIQLQLLPPNGSPISQGRGQDRDCTAITPPQIGRTPRLTPPGVFFENVLLVNFRDDLPKERIAEILAENDLTANEVTWGLGSFIVAVDPAQRDAVLTRLTSEAYQSEIDYAETIKLR